MFGLKTTAYQKRFIRNRPCNVLLHFKKLSQNFVAISVNERETITI